jgi:ComF family protein
MSVLELAIGWLAPPECLNCGSEGTAFCAGCSVTEIVPFGERCYQCNKMSPGGRTCPACRAGSPGHVWIVTDYENLAKGLVQKLKFHHQRAAAEPLAQIMLETLFTFTSPMDMKRKNYLIVPVPTATSRVRERSFDHTDLLAGKISKKLDLGSSNTLKRLGQARQVGAKRSIRQKQATDNYYVFNPVSLKGRNILLIDDVVTTGATLRAATATLRKAGARSVDALVFAKRL